MSDEFHINPDGSWTYSGEDSRLRDRTRNQVTWRIWNPIKQEFVWETMDKVYCFNCGADGGYSSRNSLCVKYICDKCHTLPGFDERFIPMAPTAEWRWRNGLPEEGD